MRAFARSDTGNITFPFQPRAQTQAFAARLQVQPTTTEMKALDALISAYVDDLIWAQADAIYVPAWLSANTQAMLLNLKGDTYNMVVKGNVTPQLVSGKPGYALKTDGAVGSYLQSNLIPSSATGLNYAQNSGTLAVYPVTEGQEAAQAFGFDTGAGTGQGTGFIVPRNSSDQFSTRVNNVAGTNVTGANSIAARMILARRTTSTNSNVYLGGSTSATTTSNAASASLPTTALSLLGTAAVPSGRQVGLAFIGSAISGVNQPIFEAPATRFLIDMGVK